MGRQTEEEEAAESPQEEQPEEEDIYDDGEGGSEVIKILKQVKAPQGEATQRRKSRRKSLPISGTGERILHLRHRKRQSLV